MTPEEAQVQLRAVRDACLANAEASLSVAERELDRGVDHICFHLALLALEEIGKSILATISCMTTAARSERPGSLERWTITRRKSSGSVGASMLQQLDTHKGRDRREPDLARTLHGRRLESLYTDPNEPIPVEERIQPNEARMITELTRARLELEKTHEMVDLAKEDVEDIAWFFGAIDDVEKQKEILVDVFGEARDSKPTEAVDKVGCGSSIVRTTTRCENMLKRVESTQTRSRRSPYAKISHDAPDPNSIALDSKQRVYQMERGVDWIKIRKSDRKDTAKVTKGEILLDLTFPKSIHANSLWEHGLLMSRTVVIALNIGTLGVFWWHVEKDVAKFYEQIIDLEADPKGGVASL